MIHCQPAKEEETAAAARSARIDDRDWAGEIVKPPLAIKPSSNNQPRERRDKVEAVVLGAGGAVKGANAQGEDNGNDAMPCTSATTRC